MLSASRDPGHAAHLHARKGNLAFARSGGHVQVAGNGAAVHRDVRAVDDDAARYVVDGVGTFNRADPADHPAQQGRQLATAQGCLRIQPPLPVAAEIACGKQRIRRILGVWLHLGVVRLDGQCRRLARLQPEGPVQQRHRILPRYGSIRLKAAVWVTGDQAGGISLSNRRIIPGRSAYITELTIPLLCVTEHPVQHCSHFRPCDGTGWLKASLAIPLQDASIRHPLRRRGGPMARHIGKRRRRGRASDCWHS
ncbi:hypothetical protein D3C81_1216850 [compost metagenome]